MKRGNMNLLAHMLGVLATDTLSDMKVIRPTVLPKNEYPATSIVPYDGSTRQQRRALERAEKKRGT